MELDHCKCCVGNDCVCHEEHVHCFCRDALIGVKICCICEKTEGHSCCVCRTNTGGTFCCICGRQWVFVSYSDGTMTTTSATNTITRTY